MAYTDTSCNRKCRGMFCLQYRRGAFYLAGVGEMRVVDGREGGKNPYSVKRPHGLQCSMPSLPLARGRHFLRRLKRQN